MQFTVKEITDIVGGKLIQGNEQTKICYVEIDSRKVKANTLFVPFVGEKVDGHDYVEKAFESGADAAFIERNLSVAKKDKALILVKSSLIALQKLAKAYRDKFSIEIIGVTGSVGKTSTREMIVCALSSDKKVFQTTKNFNSDIGLPLTMFRLDDTYDLAVVEMAMGYPGEMAGIAPIARAHQAVITNIGICHIEKLKTKENILKEKLHITDFFDKSSVLFVNGDDELLCGAVKSVPYQVIKYGFGNNCDYKGEDIEYKDMKTRFSVQMHGRREIFEIPEVGQHNVQNALVAIAVAEYNGLSVERIKDNLLLYEAQSGRQSIHKIDSVIVIDDCYNASPISMINALDVLRILSNSENKKSVAVLADMLELGDEAIAAHESIGKCAVKNRVDELITVGELGRVIADAAMKKSSHMVVKSFDTNEQVIEYLRMQDTKDMVILVKGSRGMHLEDIVNSLIAK